MIARPNIVRITLFISLLISNLAYSQTVAKVVYHDDPTPAPVFSDPAETDFSTTDPSFSRDSIAVGDYLMERLSSPFFVGPPPPPVWVARRHGSVAAAADFLKKIKTRVAPSRPAFFESLVGEPFEIKKVETHDASGFAAWQDAEGNIQFEWKAVPGERAEQFSVVRQVGKGFWEVVGKVKNTTASGSSALRFTDENPPVGKVSYRLKTTDSTGRVSFGSVILLETNFKK